MDWFAEAGEDGVVGGVGGGEVVEGEVGFLEHGAGVGEGGEGGVHDGVV